MLIQAQQVLVSATQFIGDLNKCLASQSGMYYMFERMQQLDAWANSVIAQMELLPLVAPSSDFGDHNESITAHSIRAIARIKLARYTTLQTNHTTISQLTTKSSAQIKTHRFRAFSDIPIFLKRHCDLTAAAAAANQPAKPTGIHNISCSCSKLDSFQRATSTEYMTPSDSSTSSDIHDMNLDNYVPQYAQHPFASGFPYSTQQSAKICLQAALVISRLFHSIPAPQPLSDARQPGRPLPRTMPSFACCLMQSSYAMFMIYYKARVAKQLSPDSENERGGDSTAQLIEELRQGLERIIAAVSSYSLAFEALDGMRGMISLFIFDVAFFC
jgi:hypothetical protein